MPNHLLPDSTSIEHPELAPQSTGWPTFPEILQQLHQAGIYIHHHQLAEFFLRHGLPVELDYVPEHLRQRAEKINANYQGDMAKLETVQGQPSMFLWE